MKKTLILSITMSIILIISSLTAVFAWYMANSTVDASGATIMASSDHDKIRVSLNITDGYAYSIDLSSLYGTVMTKPTAPKGQVTTANSKFVYAENNTQTGQTEVSNENYVIKSVNFYLKNITEDTVPLVVNGNLSGELANKLAWVLIVDGVNDYVLTNGYNTVTVTNGIATTGTPVAPSSTDITVAPEDVVTCTLLLWVDGVAVGDDDQIKDAYLNFNFAPPEQN